MSREKALKDLRVEYPYDKNLIEYVIAKLDLTEKEFDRIFHLPVKTFNDYANYYQIIKIFRFPLLWGVKLGLLPELLYQKFFPDKIS